MTAISKIASCRILQLFFFTILSSHILISCGQSSPVTVTSPDGNIIIEITTSGGADGLSLTYNVTYGGTPVVTDSYLGIVLNGNVDLSKQLKIISTAYESYDGVYAVSLGKSREAMNKYNEATMSFVTPNKMRFDLVFRVFDDGTAYRYRFPEQNALNDFEITDEKSSFCFTGDHEYWGLHLQSYTTSYEAPYTVSRLSTISPDSLTVLPLLIKVSDTVWAGITEADLTDYAGMYLRGDVSEDFRLNASLSPLPDGSGVCVKAEPPHESPWRVLMLGSDPGRLAESNIVLNLNDPCETDYMWIKPGKSAWDWWNAQNVQNEGFEGAMDTRTMKHYIDFAGDYELEYMLVDAGWYPRYRNVGDSQADGDITVSIPEIDIPELVEYGRERNVDIVLWLHWIPVDRDMDTAFPLYEQWGVKGVKIDFMDRDDQEMVNFYHRVVKKAAEHHLLVDFHGAYKPTGIRRTYPNLITREGVMGLEYVKWSANITPDHDCILPFTRMLAGPMDYTPGGFNNTIRGEFKAMNKNAMTMGTRAHQLALFVIYESPFQVLADYPANYRNNPEMEFLRDVPATWDETRVIHADVGDYTTFARKNGDEWYVGSITDWTPRELSLPLDFLGAGEYVAEIYADGADADENAESVAISTETLTAGSTLNITLAPGGGYAARFYPVQ